ncbi:ASCH domain-containing protein [Bacteroides sp.]|uniref:ASCH domain-containing protein n=1 Tax=Bacteroides sp. TaxID=29523 RepID=UPI002632ACF0|nr:ASCH domain-containing protein [Bacteroides sp.]
MKAITIKQPWASLIVHGIKDIENRTWACPKKYIGQRVLIHASKRRRWVEPLSIFSLAQFEVIRDDKRFIRGSNTNPQVIDSAIIGSVEIVDCVINHPSIWAEKTEVKADEHGLPYYGDKTYNWVLANPVLFANPIPAKGKLSFWDYPGIKEVKIECPECGSIEIAVEDYTTAPFPTFLHSCNKCGHVIMESEWAIK